MRPFVEGGSMDEVEIRKWIAADDHETHRNMIVGNHKSLEMIQAFQNDL